VRDGLIACAEKGGSSETELRRKIAMGHTVLWETSNGTLALDRTTDDACIAWLGAGKNVIREWLAQEPAIAAWAKEQGCRVLRLEGRRGWLRVLPHWTFKGMIDGVARMEREL
jgi:hypothetical protein